MSKFLDKTGISHLWEKIVDFFTTKKITWAELKDLRDNGKLVPGRKYRITDYTCTTTQENTKSAGHLFDIIVVANSESELSEEAKAAHHEDDTYFANSKLSAWKVWYRLDNDTEHFNWADAANGKGVIYRLIDEHNNDCGYDFKNIKYLRDADFVAKYDKDKSLLKSEDGYFYTFSSKDGKTDVSVTLADNMKIFPHDNTIKAYTEEKGTLNEGEEDYRTNPNLKVQLPDNILFGGDGFSFDDRGKGIGSYDSIYGNYIGEHAHYNILTVPISNTIKGYFFHNLFRKFTIRQTFSGYVYFNTFSGYVYYNTFSGYVKNNTFSDDVYYNTFSGYVCYNTFSGYVCYNTFSGNYVYYNTFSCNYIQSSTFSGYVYYNTFSGKVQYNTFSGYVQNNTFSGNYVYYNTFSGNVQNNTFSGTVQYNTFSGNVKNNTFSGNYVCYNTFSGYVYYNTFSGNMYDNTFSGYVQNNTFSGLFEDNQCPLQITSCTFKGRYNNLKIQAMRTSLTDSKELSGYNFRGQQRNQDASGDNAKQHVITLTAQDYKAAVGLQGHILEPNSKGELVDYIPADALTIDGYKPTIVTDTTIDSPRLTIVTKADGTSYKMFLGNYGTQAIAIALGDITKKQSSVTTDTLATLTIGEEVVSEVADNGFTGCTALISVVISHSVKSIGASAFSGCTALKDIKYNGTLDEWKAVTKGTGWAKGIAATSVTCFDGTDTIG